MSFLGYESEIKAGATVFAWIGRTHTKPFTVTPGELLNTRFGVFPHDDMLGLPYGSQVELAKGYGFIYLLHPLAELWTLLLPHRTQIVYTPDAAYIAQRLNINAGLRVLEAGTGSGSFTHALSRNVGPRGHLFTYEFHEPRYLEARAEITAHGLSNTTITHRDVCKQGFAVDDATAATAVFLDLPAPWEAIAHLDLAVAQTQPAGVCCFLPCMEQVTKTVEALQEHGWGSIEMVEVAGRRWEHHKQMVRTVDDALERLRDVKRRKNQGIELRKGDEEKEWSPLPPAFNPWGKGKRVREGEEGYEWVDVSRAESEIRSHTSYLTFAWKVRMERPTAEPVPTTQAAP